MIVRALAPAKINLGLEVIGRRADGFHDLCTVMAAISLVDRLDVWPHPQTAITSDSTHLGEHDNIAVRAVKLLEDLSPLPPLRMYLRKRIPLASGLGGASSDAAAALLAIRALASTRISEARLVQIGAELGSDVPFFFTGGCALVEGRGERVSSLPAAADHFAVIVVPAVQIPAKTATLYRLLAPADFSPGDRVRESAAARRPGERFLGNAFARPLYDLVPELRTIPDLLRAAGGTHVGLSGAGPSHYALCDDAERAHAIARIARDRLDMRGRVYVARLIGHGITLNIREESAGGGTDDCSNERARPL